MTQEAGTPPDFWGRIQKMIEDAVAKLARSGMLRNASISGGGLTIKGGFLRLLTKATGGVSLIYAGPSGGVLGDGNVQQVLIIRRADGSSVLDLYDAFPGVDGTLNQALTWRDRAGNAVLADDTDSGEGLARPWMPTTFYPTRSGDWPLTTASSWESIYEAETPKHNPQLRVVAKVAADAGTTGQLRLTVEGDQFDDVVTVIGGGSGSIQLAVFGPLPVPGGIMSTLHLKLDAQRTAGAGNVRVSPLIAEGRQT